ncbi:hypothetical protein NDU88_005642 [Pleurodeles waltl]|uniref:Uncharacterized protein n=1 Tax=Pleurodeles waltl TaxID=8319 RepID=A0AAV7NQU9_PLEWA|nr:hypothetical protein NDU88_005642 [Pleurodeles waltl]
MVFRFCCVDDATPGCHDNGDAGKLLGNLDIRVPESIGKENGLRAQSKEKMPTETKEKGTNERTNERAKERTKDDKLIHYQGSLELDLAAFPDTFNNEQVLLCAPAPHMPTRIFVVCEERRLTGGEGNKTQKQLWRTKK